MFKISPATPQQLKWAIPYLGQKTSGMVMVLEEDGKCTGAVCFDITKYGAVLETLRVDNPEMKLVTAKAALNFIEQNGIFDVFAAGDEVFYKSIGFTESGDRLHLNLEGYFTSHETEHKI